MDLVGPLARSHVTGQLEPSVESALRARPALIRAAARELVMTNFPETVAPDVLEAVGLDPQEVLGASDLPDWPGGAVAGRKSGRQGTDPRQLAAPAERRYTPRVHE
jgi:hypothetical protein